MLHLAHTNLAILLNSTTYLYYPLKPEKFRNIFCDYPQYGPWGFAGADREAGHGAAWAWADSRRADCGEVWRDTDGLSGGRLFYIQRRSAARLQTGRMRAALPQARKRTRQDAGGTEGFSQAAKGPPGTGHAKIVKPATQKLMKNGCFSAQDFH